jgi:hypothetical protein
LINTFETRLSALVDSRQYQSISDIGMTVIKTFTSVIIFWLRAHAKDRERGKYPSSAEWQTVFTAVSGIVWQLAFAKHKRRPGAGAALSILEKSKQAREYDFSEALNLSSTALKAAEDKDKKTRDFSFHPNTKRGRGGWFRGRGRGSYQGRGSSQGRGRGTGSAN